MQNAKAARKICSQKERHHLPRYLHTVGSVHKTFNILPIQATVAALGNWNAEQAFTLNGIEQPFGCDLIFGINGSYSDQQTHAPLELSHFDVTSQHQVNNYDYPQVTDENPESVLDYSKPSEFTPTIQFEEEELEQQKCIPDRRVEIIQRALDFIDEIITNQQEDCLWSVLLLQQKLSDVLDYLLSEPKSDASETAPDTTTLINDIDQRIGVLSSKIYCAERTQTESRDPMGFDLLNRIRHWFLLGGRSNTKSSDNNLDDHPETSRKRSYHQGEYDENSPERLIKYRRVDNTFPKYMPNAVDEYTQMSDLNQRKDQENNSNHMSYPRKKRLSMFCTPQTRHTRVRNTQPTVTIDLSDSEEQQSNEPNMYQAFADRLVGDNETICNELKRSSSARPNLLYSDAVRFGTNGFDMDYPRPSSSIASSEARLNGHVNNLYDTSVNRENVLLLEERRNDHNQYIHLINNLTLQEREQPLSHRSMSIRDTEMPPPPPPLQRINLNGDEWLRSLIKNKPASIATVCPERDEYNKLLESKTNYQDNKTLINLAKKPAPPLIHRNNIGSVASNNSVKSLSIDRTPDVNWNVTNFDLMPPPSRPMTKAMQLRHSTSVYFADNYTELFNEKCARLQQETEHMKQMVLLEAEKTTEERRAFEQGLRESLSKRRFLSKPIFVLEKIPSLEKSEPEIVPFTKEHHECYNELIHGPPQQVLVSKFSLNITRTDIRTLTGSCWLNDEVINFYMNLLTDRSEQNEGKLPSVYAMNTFFVPRLLQNGHGAVKRWTRKVDLFSKDIIPVPVHVGGVHWCMAIIHMKNKTIRYYDSMGKPNNSVLNALEMYLREESMDKRKRPFDTSDFQIENVQNVPQQTNGSDCGVFSCMFAEYITRDKPLTFSQEHMEYFRKKMILEICGGELWM